MEPEKSHLIWKFNKFSILRIIWLNPLKKLKLVFFRVLKKIDTFLKKKYLSREKKIRENNTVVFGFKHTGKSTMDFVTSELLKIKIFRSLGKRNPVQWKLNSFLTKIYLLKNVENFRDIHIFIADDSTIKRQLIEVLAKTCNYFIKHNKLWVDNDICRALEFQSSSFEEPTAPHIEQCLSSTFQVQ